MDYLEHTYTVSELVGEFRSNALRVNQEYQRGAVWTTRQQGKFIDSLFRRYPVPAIFLRAIEHHGLRGSSTTFELIDGQQRIRALDDFIADKLQLFPVTGPERLRLPASVATAPAPWSARKFSELGTELRQQLQNTDLRVFVINHPTSDDEVRDLFIRLQAGTALTRQQVRDAWPGPISPFVESIGGKGRHGASSPLLSMVDKRGDRDADDDATDTWVAHRQTCAQLLSSFMARERDPYAKPRISAEDLDELYHETSEFDRSGDVAGRFRSALEKTKTVFEAAGASQTGRRTKWKKVHIFGVFLVVQDIQKSVRVPLDRNNLDQLARLILEREEQWSRGGRVRFSGSAIAKLSEELRELFFSSAGRLDDNRTFTSEQKEILWQRAGGKCQICSQAVPEGEAEYDHFPIPWAMCGPTDVGNGRLVHESCHPRGRPRGEGSSSETLDRVPSEIVSLVKLLATLPQGQTEGKPDPDKIVALLSSTEKRVAPQQARRILFPEG